MKCPPFELPVRYKCSISKDRSGRSWANLLILDAKEKVIEQIASQCKPSTGTLTASLRHIQENYKYIVQTINSHEKLRDTLKHIAENGCSKCGYVAEQALEAEKQE
ncbi:MAG: hypothetical protein KAS32_07585 [Candidatus Peribacteraceae bacterium]|nr:hypothetical protein [Candidatus Peribacteraceae bacterium]